MKKLSAHVVIGTFLLCLSHPALADPVRLNFEEIPDGTQLGSLSGLVFTNATVLTAGVSLNEFEFPPRSGENVVGDIGGPLSIAFGSPAGIVEVFATYLTPVTLTAYDPSGTLLAAITSRWMSNAALSGDPGSHPNEHLRLSIPAIARVTLTGATTGASFVVDDLTVAPVPEPATLVLFGTGAALMVRARSRRQKREQAPH